MKEINGLVNGVVKKQKRSMFTILIIFHTDPWDYKERFLTTLCADCHEEETIKIKNYEENLILILREEGFFTTDIIRLIRFIQGFTDEFAGRVKNVS